MGLSLVFKKGKALIVARYVQSLLTYLYSRGIVSKKIVYVTTTY
jgi:hypothetical protein